MTLVPQSGNTSSSVCLTRLRDNCGILLWPTSGWSCHPLLVSDLFHPPSDQFPALSFIWNSGVCFPGWHLTDARLLGWGGSFGTLQPLGGRLLCGIVGCTKGLWFARRGIFRLLAWERQVSSFWRLCFPWKFSIHQTSLCCLSAWPQPGREELVCGRPKDNATWEAVRRRVWCLDSVRYDSLMPQFQWMPQSQLPPNFGSKKLYMTGRLFLLSARVELGKWRPRSPTLPHWAEHGHAMWGSLALQTVAAPKTYTRYAPTSGPLRMPLLLPGTNFPLMGPLFCLFQVFSPVSPSQWDLPWPLSVFPINTSYPDIPYSPAQITVPRLLPGHLLHEGRIFVHLAHCYLPSA